LYANISGINNVAIGYQSLRNNNGNYNTAVGQQSLYSNTSGAENAAFGKNALYANTTGNRNTAIGYNAFYTGTAYTNSTAVGYNASISASNQVRIGNSSVTSIGGFANWTNVSDARFKKDIQENVPGLKFVLKLRPVTYRLNMDAIAEKLQTPDSLRLFESEKLKESMVQTGFIAQEVEKVAQELGYEFSGVDTPKNENDYYGLRYAEFVVPLVKALQELYKKVEIEKQSLKQQIEKQNQKINEQQKQIESLQEQLNELIK